MAAHSSILAWETSWTEEPGRLQSMGSQESAMIEHACMHARADKFGCKFQSERGRGVDEGQRQLLSRDVSPIVLGLYSIFCNTIQSSHPVLFFPTAPSRGGRPSSVFLENSLPVPYISHHIR